jgi:uncharacterized protein (TIGR02271 family)
MGTRLASEDALAVNAFEHRTFMKSTSHTAEERLASAEMSGQSKPLERDEETVIPVIQEELEVGTRRIETDSGVRIVKSVQEREELVDELLTRDEVEVERIAVNRYIEAPPSVRYEGDTMIVPVLEEVLVVEKRLLLKEELRVTRRASEYRAPQRVTLRREIADVERIEDRQSHVASDRVSAPTEPDPRESLLERKRRQDQELRRTVSPSPSRK